MKKSEQRVIATSLTAGIFLIIGISGLMLFFHISDGLVKSLHEYLGVAFVVVAILHVIYNWASMKNYFTKKVFLVLSACILIVSGGFVYNANTTSSGANPKEALIVSMLNAPLENAIIILGSDLENAQIKLQAAGLAINGESSLKELASTNKTSPFRIVDILIKK